MKIQISGNIGEYYVQTLCMLFFPGVKFSKNESEDSNLSAAVSVETLKDSVLATVVLTQEERIETGTASETIEGHAKVSAEQIACGKAFFEAGKKLTGLTPSWGILTGVRPAKLVISELNNGKTKTEVRSALTKEYLVTPKKASLVTEIAAIEKKIISRVKPTSCSLYISIPFCPSRCSYCSFVSHSVEKAKKLIPEYLEKLKTAEQQIAVQRDVFLFNTRMQTTQDDGEIARLRKAVEDDGRIVELRRRVRMAAESQLENGVIDATDLLCKITDETNAALARSTHEIELLQAIYRLKTTLNQ